MGLSRGDFVWYSVYVGWDQTKFRPAMVIEDADPLDVIVPVGFLDELLPNGSPQTHRVIRSRLSPMSPLEALSFHC